MCFPKCNKPQPVKIRLSEGKHPKQSKIKQRRVCYKTVQGIKGNISSRVI